MKCWLAHRLIMRSFENCCKKPGLAFLRDPQSVEKRDFRQTDRVQKVVKTSKPSASAYDGTVELGLRCKSKCLAQQAFEVLFCCIGDTFAIAYLNTDRQPPKICILTIGDFFDTL